MAIATVNPATGQIVRAFEPMAADGIETALARADAAFDKYRHTTFDRRAAWLRAAADLLERDLDRYAALMTLEMGKPVKQAIAEVQKCALVCRYYAERGAEFLADEAISTAATHSFISYQPIGAVLAVMPWNFPFWQVFRFAAPNLMAGNVGLLKHASNVPQCALAIADILREAGFPEGAFQTLLVGASQVEAILSDPRVKAATLTGSEPAGASLAAAAGKQIKKTVLELGGSDPFVVLASANLKAAAAKGTTARMLNSGQSCIAAKRFIVVEPVADEFQQLLVEQFARLQVGDPTLMSTDVGPLATASIMDELDAQVSATVAAGATILIGGKPDEHPGNYYPPTILCDIPPDTPAATEEFFGPVALLHRVPDFDAAMKLANATPLGLGASVWTGDYRERERAIAELDVGAVFVNELVKSDPRLPFGGTKRSGYGRELSREGIREFVNLKTIWIA
ncbi:NAD-dependent aldehyde dehydrogenase [Rubidibacter lacunae KORDI 51-2]|uniref:NAD-dependent aldehyde dehydrogenase n=1 Tax=Rubidibacter lacunae KORDI 51-2 TaxID=582515 RepID=U5DNF8_9CHRO|nr:NAD-dependent succinate-semialdehyde dehydrogenase [Rubidibacter lacunae]ERN41240.1 NAD-dependent aldehyde dehydrogenase [Rubidibacter lacunae KORDI 51-2]